MSNLGGALFDENQKFACLQPNLDSIGCSKKDCKEIFDPPHPLISLQPSEDSGNPVDASRHVWSSDKTEIKILLYKQGLLNKKAFQKKFDLLVNYWTLLNKHHNRFHCSKFTQNEFCTIVA